MFEIDHEHACGIPGQREQRDVLEVPAEVDFFEPHGDHARRRADDEQAAADTGVQLIVIRRPAETGETADQILTRCREVLKG